jgi:hypothetical protein
MLMVEGGSRSEKDRLREKREERERVKGRND